MSVTAEEARGLGNEQPSDQWTRKGAGRRFNDYAPRPTEARTSTQRPRRGRRHSLICGESRRGRIKSRPANTHDIPAGGGPSGFTTENSRHVITNGLATQEAILKLAKDIPIVVRQNFSVTIDFFPFTRLGSAANGGVLNVDLDPLLYLNQFDGAKLVQVHQEVPSCCEA